MPRLPVLASAAAFALALSASPAQAQGAPKPDTYLCPNVSSGASVDCFLDAVAHLYTMCRQVKSIEIIEFGYDKSEEGVNGAKTEYCIDKHKLSMTRPYQAALREATGSRTVVEQLRAMHERWLAALQELRWKPGETDDAVQGARRAALQVLHGARRGRAHGAGQRRHAGADRAPQVAKAKPAAKAKTAAVKAPN